MVVDFPTWPNQYVDLSQQMDTMVAAGVESIRVVFDWSEAQPYGSFSRVPAADKGLFTNVGGTPTNFSSYDALVGAAAAHHITVLPVIQNAPTWDGQTYPRALVRLPRSPGPYAAFAKALVERYGSTGSFWKANPGLPKVPITMWQIWNEPNVPAFWPPQPYYSRYVTLLRAAHNAIKAADRSAKVVLAGLPNFSWIDIARIDRFRGARNLYDVASVHPYTKNPQGVITILGYVRHVLDTSGGASKPILADEISWPSSLGHTSRNRYDFATTQSGQAQKVGQAIALLAKNRVRLRLGAFYYYDWAGQDRPNYSAFDFAGLFHFLNAVFTAKPVYNAFRTESLAIEGCRSKTGTASDCVH
jgi:hypothetical protein